MAARTQMRSLTPVEREAITDSMLKIQSIQSSLSHVEDAKIPKIGEIQECLISVHQYLRTALRGGASGPPSGS
jgi:hypothetical protein